MPNPLFTWSKEYVNECFDCIIENSIIHLIIL